MPQRDKDVQRVILIEGSVNLIVFIAKVVVGSTTGSLAVLGDAIHSLTDVVNNFVAWIVTRLSSLPPDREHPYGHRKFETLAVFFLASLLVILSFELALRAISQDDSRVVSTTWELSVMLAVLVINISLATWERTWARRLKSDILLADASHTFADVLITIAVIIGWQLSAMGYLWLDRVCALAVSVFVFFLAYNLFKGALPILVDRVALNPDSVSRVILGVTGVRQVKRVRSRWIGTDKSVDLVISVDPGISTSDSHDIASAIELLLEERFQVSDISIHVEPFNPESKMA